MGDAKSAAMFALKVYLAILVMNQIPALGAIVNKNYVSGG